MSELRGRHLLGALGLAAAAHIGAIVFVVSKPPNAGAIAVGDGGLLVSASLAGGGVVSEEAVIDDVALEPPEAAPISEAAPLEVFEETDLAEDVADVTETPVEEVAVSEVSVEDDVETRDVPEDAQEIDAVPPDDTTTVVQSPPKPRRKPQPRAEPKAKPKAEPKAKPKAKPKAEPDENTAPEPPKSVVADAESRKEDAAPAATDDVTGSPDADGASNTEALRGGGGEPGAQQNYMAQVAALLSKNKRYPRRARSRGQEGVGALFFIIDSRGRVVERELRSSTGHPLLDQEIMHMLKRSAPFPAIPSDVGRGRVEILVPVRFFLD
ncbi:MAG: TonB family protein [Neomegalonema sp.]